MMAKEKIESEKKKLSGLLAAIVARQLGETHADRRAREPVHTSGSNQTRDQDVMESINQTILKSIRPGQTFNFQIHYPSLLISN